MLNIILDSSFHLILFVLRNF